MKCDSKLLWSGCGKKTMISFKKKMEFDDLQSLSFHYDWFQMPTKM